MSEIDKFVDRVSQSQEWRFTYVGHWISDLCSIIRKLEKRIEELENKNDL